jgi:hypothetical protein
MAWVGWQMVPRKRGRISLMLVTFDTDRIVGFESQPLFEFKNRTAHTDVTTDPYIAIAQMRESWTMPLTGETSLRKGGWQAALVYQGKNRELFDTERPALVCERGAIARHASFQRTEADYWAQRLMDRLRSSGHDSTEPSPTG